MSVTSSDSDNTHTYRRYKRNSRTTTHTHTHTHTNWPVTFESPLEFGHSMTKKKKQVKHPYGDVIVIQTQSKRLQIPPTHFSHSIMCVHPIKTPLLCIGKLCVKLCWLCVKVLMVSLHIHTHTHTHTHIHSYLHSNAHTHTTQIQ